MKTIAVAPKAVGLVPMLNKMDAKMKQSDNPVADIIRRGRRPYLSTVYKNLTLK